MNALWGGVLDTDDSRDDDTAELRQLVDTLGRRSFDSRLGRRAVPEEFDAPLWRDLEDTGLTRLTSTADLGAGPVESAVLLYGLARHAAAIPIAETDMLAAWLGSQAGIELPHGPLTVAVGQADTAAGRVSGTAPDVPWTPACATVLVAANSRDGLHVGILDLASATIHEGHNLAGEPRDTIAFDVPADDLRVLDPTLATELQRRGAWARCVQIMGALDAAAALSVDHTRNRVQFGRPLSAFQSVQHSLAAMAGDIERARAATTLAISAAADHGFASPQTDYAVTVAKIVTGQVVDTATTIAHQLHGAIGVTAEHPLWLATLRAQSWVHDYGSTARHARRLGRLVLAAGDPWGVLVGEMTS